MAEPKPFKISVSDDLLAFINQRVATARLPPGVVLPADKAWSFGVPPPTISHLRDYWEKKYDWRSIEARINGRFKMFTLPISEAGEDMVIHFVHHRSEREGAIPLLFQHGWPGNFLEVDKIIDALTSPEEGQQAYHVVAPSLPGFVFSEGPKGGNLTLKNYAAVDHKLMQALGYKKYMTQGGDWGSMITRVMAMDYPESVLACHINMVVASVPSWYRNPLTFAYFVGWALWQGKGKDDGMLGRSMWWLKDEGGYMEIQGTKPLALNYGLVDSPVGMLGWLRDKMEPLVGNDFKWDDKDVITWAMLYFINGTSGHSQIYQVFKGDKAKASDEELMNRLVPSNVDFGASIFPNEVFTIPRWWAAASVAKNIVFYKHHDEGGHFASVEVPEVLVEHIREFTELIEPSRKAELVRSGKLKV